MKILEGACNKLGFLLTILSACCWIVYVVGFALEYQSLYHPGPNNSTGSDDFLDIPYISYWIYAVSSAPLYIAIFAQFMCSSVVFSLTLTLLAPVMLLSLGAALQSNLAYYYYYYLLNKQGQEIPHYVHIQLAGSLGAFLSVWCLLCVWVCAVHRVGHRVRQRNNYEEIDSF